MIYFSPVCPGMTCTRDSQCAYSGIFHMLCQFRVNAAIAMEACFGKYGIVLYFRFPRGWVLGKDGQFHFALSDHFQCLLVPQHLLSTFRDGLEPRVEQLPQLFHVHRLPALGAGCPQPRAASKMAGELERSQILVICTFPLLFSKGHFWYPHLPKVTAAPLRSQCPHPKMRSRFYQVQCFSNFVF